MKLSKSQEEKLWRAVHDRITKFRICVLKGDLQHLTPRGQDDVILRRLGNMADEVLEDFATSD